MNLGNSIVVFVFCVLSFFIIGCSKQSNYDKAVAYQNDAEYNTAIKFYNMAIAKGEKVAESEKNLGDIFFGDKKFEDSFAHYKNSIEINPNVALETVFKYISYNDIKVREFVGRTFYEIENELAQKQINENLSEILNSEDQYKILDALFIISEMKEKCIPISEDVIKLLDNDKIVKQKVLEILPNFASVISKETFDKIVDFLSDKDEIIKTSAIKCLGSMHEYGINALPNLLSVAVNEVRYKEQIFSTIDNLGLPTKEQMENMSDILKNKPKDIKIYVVNNIGNYAEKANMYVPYIIEFLNDKDPEVKQAARNSLSKIGKASPETVTMLIKLLNDKNEEIISRAIYELGDLGKDASDAMESLNQILQSISTSKEIKRLAKDALQKIQ